jgi:hypothetical protein
VCEVPELLKLKLSVPDDVVVAPDMMGERGRIKGRCTNNWCHVSMISSA